MYASDVCPVSDDRNEASYYNPLKDHSIYEIVFPDGTTDEVEANLIAECMVSECDQEGRQYRMLKEISDHRKDDTALNVEMCTLCSGETAV